MTEKSNRRSQVRLWICSTLIVASLVGLLLVADHFRQEPSDRPAMTIRVDHPGVMEGDAATLIAFMERAVNREQGNGIDVRFLGDATDLTVYFGGRRWEWGLEMDLMLIEVGPTAYVERGEVIDEKELSARLKPYFEGAALSGAVPAIALQVKKDVSLSRLLELFKLCGSFGRVYFKMESVMATLG